MKNNKMYFCELWTKNEGYYELYKQLADSKLFLPEKIAKDQVKLFTLLYKPFVYELQEKARIDYAILTMPHGFIWKLFHPTLWGKVKEELKLREKVDFEAKKSKKSKQAKRSASCKEVKTSSTLPSS